MRLINLFFGFNMALLAILNNASANESLTDFDCCDCPNTLENGSSVVKEQSSAPVGPIQEKSTTIVAAPAKEKAAPAATIVKAKSTPSNIREGYYMEVKGGIDKPKLPTDNFKHPQFKLDKSAIFEVRGGYNFKHFAVDLTVTHSPKSRLHLDDTGDVFTPNDKFRHRANIKFTAVMLSAYYNVFNVGGFTPYIGAGAGMSRNTTSKLQVYSDADLTTATTVPGKFVFYKSRNGRSTNNFMWQGIAGGRFQIGKDWEVGMEYKYMDLGKWTLGGSTAQTAIGIEPDKVQKSKFKVHSFLGGIRYYF